MNKLNFLFCVLTFAGCSIFQPEESSIIQPKLLKQSALPPIKQSAFSDSYEFYCQLVINKDGNVEKANLLTSSGDKTWDSLTTTSLLAWKFSPAIVDGKPIRLTIRRKFIVMYERPILISLAEIQVKDISLADSIYKALVDGSDFSMLALKYSISSSRELKGYLGVVDVNHFSKDICDVLSRLEESEFTSPIKYGENFIILKRLKE